MTNATGGTPRPTEADRQNRNTLQQCEKANEHERAGDYDGARKALSGIWSIIGQKPDLGGLEPETQGRVLLRVGALAGRLGSTQQVTGAQEFAKDLIGESLRIFQSIGNEDRIAEAQIDLGICYWREGAFDEARVLFQEARSRRASPEKHLRAFVNSTLPEISSGHHDVALRLLAEAAPLLELVSADDIHGSYYMQRALAFKNLGGAENFDRALLDYAAAVFHLEKAGHTRYVAAIENNIGFILLLLQRHSEAIIHLDRARSIFVELKDTASVAQVNETRARAYLAQQRNADAERVAFAAVSTLEHGGEQALLAEALITHGTALARLGKRQAAQSSFTRAATISDIAGDLRSSALANLTMIRELLGSLSTGEMVEAFLDADSRLPSQLDANVVDRLRSCARIIAEAVRTASVDTEQHLIGGTLEEEVRHFEGQLIKKALEREQGSVTRAARALGMSHQGLTYLIKYRHKALANTRTPPRRRNKSIMKR